MPKRNLQSAFTLMELLVVVSIIGALAALLLVNLQGSRARARDAVRKQDMRQMKTALRLYYNDYQTYPGNTAGNQISGCGAAGTSTCNWGGSFDANGSEYMGYLPEDPVNSGNYRYRYTLRNSGDGFTLTTELENESDSDIQQSQARCGAGTGNQYVVCED